jgi:hypothetical protein
VDALYFLQDPFGEERGTFQWDKLLEGVQALSAALGVGGGEGGGGGGGEGGGADGGEGGGEDGCAGGGGVLGVAATVGGVGGGGTTAPEGKAE